VESWGRETVRVWPRKLTCSETVSGVVSCIAAIVVVLRGPTHDKLAVYIVDYEFVLENANPQFRPVGFISDIPRHCGNVQSDYPLLHLNVMLRPFGALKFRKMS